MFMSMYERTLKAKPKQIRQLSETLETSVLVLMSQYVTTQLSPVSLPARFCTPPEVKFHVFRQLKCGEEKKFSIFLSKHHVDLIKQIKKIYRIHFKKAFVFCHLIQKKVKKLNLISDTYFLVNIKS